MEETCDNIMKEKVEELHKTKEEIKQAKEDAIKLWLHSRPLINELERLQTGGLNVAKNRSSMSTIVISELETQLETTLSRIESKMEEELKFRSMITKTSHELNETRDEMERIELETQEERRARSKWRQVLRLRRQSLQTLQLTLRALRLESEGFTASAAEALEHIGMSRRENTQVELTQEEYDELIRAAEEETYLSDWRVSASSEQRLAAEESRDLALKRLRKLYGSTEEEITEHGDEDSRIMSSEEESCFPKARVKLLAELDETNQRSPQRLVEVSETSDSSKSAREKTPSICNKIKNFIVQIT